MNYLFLLFFVSPVLNKVPSRILLLFCLLFQYDVMFLWFPLHLFTDEFQIYLSQCSFNLFFIYQVGRKSQSLIRDSQNVIVGQQFLLYISGGMEKSTTPLEWNLLMSRKIVYAFTFNPEIPLLGVQLKNKGYKKCKMTYLQGFYCSIFYNSKRLEIIQLFFVDRGLIAQTMVYIMEYHETLIYFSVSLKCFRMSWYRLQININTHVSILYLSNETNSLTEILNYI